MKNGIGASFAVALVGPLIASGDVPTIINFQGRLMDGTNLVNGTVGLEIRLFNVPSGGGPRYEDSKQVALADGLHSTFIGDQTNSGNFAQALTNAEVYVETAVNGTTLTPRERLASVAYALRAGDSVQLGGLDATAYATGSPLYVESDPSWVSASTGIQQQLDAQASGLAAATTGLVQVEAEVDSLQSAVSVLASQVKRIEAGVTNMHEYGPTRFSVAFTPPFNQTPIVTVTPQLPGADAFVLASGTTGFVGMAGSTGYTVSASVINSYRDEGRHSSIAEISSRPAIAYYDATSNLLMYVRALTGNGLPGPSSWGAPVTVDQVAINASIIDRVSLLTVNGRPAIAYADAITRDIKYVRASNSVGSSWSAPVTVGNAGGGVGPRHGNRERPAGHCVLHWRSRPGAPCLYARAGCRRRLVGYTSHRGSRGGHGPARAGRGERQPGPQLFQCDQQRSPVRACVGCRWRVVGRAGHGGQHRQRRIRSFTRRGQRPSGHRLLPRDEQRPPLCARLGYERGGLARALDGPQHECRRPRPHVGGGQVQPRDPLP
jgi:hypothetical protein